MWTMRNHGCTKIYSHPDILFSIIETKKEIVFLGKQFRTVNAAKKYAEGITFRVDTDSESP